MNIIKPSCQGSNAAPAPAHAAMVYYVHVHLCWVCQWHNTCKLCWPHQIVRTPHVCKWFSVLSTLNLWCASDLRTPLFLQCTDRICCWSDIPDSTYRLCEPIRSLKRAFSVTMGTFPHDLSESLLSLLSCLGCREMPSPKSLKCVVVTWVHG